MLLTGGDIRLISRQRFGGHTGLGKDDGMTHTTRKLYPFHTGTNVQSEKFRATVKNVPHCKFVPYARETFRATLKNFSTLQICTPTFGRQICTVKVENVAKLFL